MNLFKLELRTLRKSATIGTLCICAAIFAMLAFFPSMQNESMQALAGTKLDGLNPALLAAFGLTKLLDFSLINHFFGYVLQFIALAIMILMVQQAINLFIKEETDGTIEFLGAKPVSRGDIFVQKLLAHILIVLVMILACALTTIAGYLTFCDVGFGAAIQDAVLYYAGIAFIALVYSAVGVLLSTLIKSSKGSSGLTIAIVFGTFALGIVAQLTTNLGFLIYIAPLEWVKGEKLLNTGIRPGEWGMGIGITAVCLAAAWFRYRQKDLLV